MAASLEDNSGARWSWVSPVAHLALRLAVLVLCAVACLGLYATLQVRGDPHASLLYVLSLYIFVLPALLWHLAVYRTRHAGVIQFARWRWAVLVLCSSTVLSVAFYLRHGGISDESAYKFQARIFAAGKLKAVPMPGAISDVLKTPTSIHFEQTIQTPTGWFSKYPPGWPLILAIGYWLHCPWLINPILGFLQLFLAWHLARRWGRVTQSLAIVMVASSGFFLAFTTGFMSHASEGLITLLALSSLLEGIEKKRFLWIAATFLLVVAATEIRPYTGAVLGALCAAIIVYEWKCQFRLLFPALVIMVGLGSLAVATFCWVNVLYTGHPLVTPYAMIMGGANIHELTFNPVEIAVNILHTWRWSITDTLRVTFPFMLLFAAYACWKEEVHRRELVYLSLLFPLLILAYFFQSEGSGGSATGERFYFEGFVPITVVAARGFILLGKNWALRPSGVYSSLAVLLCLQAAQLIFTIGALKAQKWPYIRAYQAAHRDPPPLVFVSIVSPLFSAHHANWNEADWRSASTVYLVDPGPALRDRVACRFGRPHYRVVRETVETGTLEYEENTAHCSNPQ